ncbi:MAG: aspartate kinase [Candidatus Kapaibacterium sp.]
MRILKFGGTSVQSADAIKQAAACVLNCNSSKKTVILSAASGVTDLLTEAVHNVLSDISYSISIIEKLRQRHIVTADELLINPRDIHIVINNIFDELTERLIAVNELGELTALNIDAVISRGELLSTKIFSAYLTENNKDCLYLDIRSLLKTDANFTKATVDFTVSAHNFNTSIGIFENNDIIITQGFIASDKSGRTTTLGRGGSDYSAAVIGSLLMTVGADVEEIQIWTDVNGVLTADPKLLPNAFTIQHLSYEEVRIMSFLGAKVLHPDTIKPALNMNIPIRVMNTFNSTGGNTVISDAKDDEQSIVKSLVSVGNVFETSIKSDADKSGYAHAEALFDIFSNAQIKIIFSSVSDSEIKVYSVNNPDFLYFSKFSDSMKIQNLKMCALTGNKLTFMLNNICLSLPELVRICGISDNAVYLCSNQEITQETLMLIHKNLIENKIEGINNG